MATATQPAHKKELDPRLRSSTSRHFEDALREKIVGQNEAVQALVELHQMFCAGLHSPGVWFSGSPSGTIGAEGRRVRLQHSNDRIST